MSMCSICHDELEQSIIPICDNNHSFHNHCIRTWYKKNNTCPLCRSEFEIELEPTNFSNFTEQQIVSYYLEKTEEGFDFAQIIAQIVETALIPQLVICHRLSIPDCEFEPMIIDLITSEMVNLTNILDFAKILIINNYVDILSVLISDLEWNPCEELVIWTARQEGVNDHVVALLLLCSKFKPSSNYIVLGYYSGFHFKNKKINRLLNTYYHSKQN